MNEGRVEHRLTGLEPDNLLAFLALLGLLRSIEAADRDHRETLKLRPRACWDTEIAPLRPVLLLARPIESEEIPLIANEGLSTLASAHRFGGRKDLNYSRTEAREVLETAAYDANSAERDRADLLASLMTDAAIKDDKNFESAVVDPTPFCLLYGQGHQHFMERMAAVPATPAPPKRGRGERTLSAAECIAEALFEPWHRSDPTFSFRWDPQEDMRYALMAGDPTDSAYKGGTQHGANRLAAIGLAVLTVVPVRRAGRIRPAVIGGSSDSQGFSFRWPVWNRPATLTSIRSLLSHPDLLKTGALGHLGVQFVQTTRRISVGKFMNFTRATPR